MQTSTHEVGAVRLGVSKTIRPERGPLRIVHTVSSLQVGGMEQFVLRIAAAQRARGHEVTIMALRGGPLADEARRLGIPVRILSGAHRALRLGDGALTMARLRPQVVHAHNPTSLHYALLGRLVCGARVVMTDHGQGIESYRDPSDREWDRTAAVVAVSDAVAQRRQSPATGGKTRVIRNGVEPVAATRDRATVRAELGLSPDQFVGIIVARIDGLKGHETLLKAVARLKQTGDPARRMTLLIAGDGAKRSACEALTEDLGLTDDWVRFLGFRTDAPDLLAAADLFLLPSLTEGLPLSVLEAMTHGLPVISTPVGGVPEVVLPGRTGVLVPTEEPEALAGAIATMIQDRATRLRLGEAGRERARSEFSFPRMVARYDALYREVFYG